MDWVGGGSGWRAMALLVLLFGTFHDVRVTSALPSKADICEQVFECPLGDI